MPRFRSAARPLGLALWIAASAPRADAAEPGARGGEPVPSLDAAAESPAPRVPTTPPGGYRRGLQIDEPRYGRAALEVLGALGIGLAQYWLNAPSNSRDWDDPTFFERFTSENIRFDANTHLTNNLLHPLAGASYYGLSRANGVGVGISVLYAQLGSAAWEWGLEWREKVSINDMISTTAGGVAAGEFLTQLAAYLNSSPGETTLAQDVAKLTLGLPVWIQDELDDRRADPNIAPDHLGFSSEYRHRFTADLQNAWLDDTAEERQIMTGIALNAHLAYMPGFLSPRSFGTWFAEGNFTEASLEMHFNDEGHMETEIKFDAVLSGYYAQLADPSIGFMAGLGTGLEFLDRDTLEQSDKAGVIHFAGPTFFTFWRAGALHLTAAARLYGDFAVIHSLAWPEVYSSDPTQVYKGGLEDGGYQYHLGLSGRSYLGLRWHSLFVEGEFAHGRYQSIEGLDRFQENLTRDIQGSESLQERRISLAIEPSGSPARFYVGVERFSHQSELGSVRSERLERRLLAGAGVAF